MKRRLFNVLAAVSLVLCVVIVAIWIRSYFAYNSVSRTTWNPATEEVRLGRVEVSRGRAQFFLLISYRPKPLATRVTPRWQYGSFGVPIDAGRGWFWFYHPVRMLWSTGVKGWQEVWEIGFQLWPLFVLFSVSPFSWLTTRRRAASGCCPRCGYDLRATPERCPECGSAVKPTA